MCRSERARRAGIAGLVLLAGALAGCVETALIEAHRPFDYEPIAAPPPPERTEGAIYPGHFAAGSFLSFDRKARGVGDLVTVVVSERVRASNDAATTVSSDSNLRAAIASDVGLQALVGKPISEVLSFLLGADTNDVPAGTPLNVADARTRNEFEGTGETERGGRFDAVITCRVVAELPNDVLHIRGRRATVVNHELQYLTIEGLVRRQDIGIDNVVPSTALAEARIALDGIGVVDDKQRPGWFTRVMGWAYPF